MKLKARAIVSTAVEDAVGGAVPYAFARWYKHRPRDPAAHLLETQAFQDHVAKTVCDLVLDGLEDILDYEEHEGGDDTLRLCDAGDAA